MTLFYSDVFVLPLPSHHRFPMGKYLRLRERLLASGHFVDNDFRVPEAASDAEITRAHCPQYLQRVASGALGEAEIRAIGFPWSERMVERSRRSSGATLAAARAMQVEAGLKRVAIVDCDVHQGNGTASIFAGDESVFTFSIHGARNFPFAKEASDLDIELADGTRDEEYLWHLERGLDETLERSRPQLAFYLAGADPYEDDRLGRLALTKQGLARRDELVLRRLAARGIPVAIAMAGGYARNIEDSIEIHANTIRTARRMES